MATKKKKAKNKNASTKSTPGLTRHKELSRYDRSSIARRLYEIAKNNVCFDAVEQTGSYSFDVTFKARRNTGYVAVLVLKFSIGTAGGLFVEKHDCDSFDPKAVEVLEFLSAFERAATLTRRLYDKHSVEEKSLIDDIAQLIKTCDHFGELDDLVVDDDLVVVLFNSDNCDNVCRLQFMKIEKRIQITVLPANVHVDCIPSALVTAAYSRLVDMYDCMIARLQELGVQICEQNGL